MNISTKKILQCCLILLKTSTRPSSNFVLLLISIFLTMIFHPSSIFKRTTKESQKHFLTDYLKKPIIVKSPENFYFIARPKFEDLPRFLFSHILAKWKPLSLISGNNLVFIDIGANVGYYTLKLSTKFSNCKILAIEAEPETFKILSKNCELNNLQNTKLLNLAVAEKNGIVKLSRSKTHSGTSSIVSKQNSNEDIISINCSTLDSLLNKSYENIDWIKIDVEGSELNVLNGAIQTLKITKNILIELHEEILNQNNQSYKEIIYILEQNGFQITTFNKYWNSKTSQNQELKSDYILAEKH